MLPKEQPESTRLSAPTAAHMEEIMAKAVHKGIRDALTEETAELFWSAGLAVLQKQATNHAGRFVLGGLWGAIRKLSMFVALGGIVYALGGWTALTGFAKTIFSQGISQ